MTTAERLRSLVALVRRLIPTDELGPGAEEAEVCRFIENELRGPLRSLRGQYDEGLAALDQKAVDEYSAPFAELPPDDQDALLAAIEKADRDGPDALLRGFFDLALNHTIDGFLSDPVHGGNADFVGWKLVGYPGVNLTPGPELQELDREVPFHGTSLASFPQYNPVERADD